MLLGSYLLDWSRPFDTAWSKLCALGSRNALPHSSQLCALFSHTSRTKKSDSVPRSLIRSFVLFPTCAIGFGIFFGVTETANFNQVFHPFSGLEDVFGNVIGNSDFAVGIAVDFVPERMKRSEFTSARPARFRIHYLVRMSRTLTAPYTVAPTVTASEIHSPTVVSSFFASCRRTDSGFFASASARIFSRSISNLRSVSTFCLRISAWDAS